MDSSETPPHAHRSITEPQPQHAHAGLPIVTQDVEDTQPEQHRSASASAQGTTHHHHQHHIGHGRRLSGATAAALRLLPSARLSLDSIPPSLQRPRTVSGPASPNVTSSGSISGLAAIAAGGTQAQPDGAGSASHNRPILNSSHVPGHGHKRTPSATTSSSSSPGPGAARLTPSSLSPNLLPHLLGRSLARPASANPSSSIPHSSSHPHLSTPSASPSPSPAPLGLSSSRSRLLVDHHALLSAVSTTANPSSSASASHSNLRAASASPFHHPLTPQPTMPTPSAFTAAGASGQEVKDSLVHKTVATVLNARRGAVLARNFILKADHFPQAVNPGLGLRLHGSPNFRMHDQNVYGVAQPTASGLATILTLLSTSSTSPTIWICTREEPLLYICGRPYVLRHMDHPRRNLSTLAGISGTRLEQLEARLRDDVLVECALSGNLLLVHEELADGCVVPTWVSPTTTDDILTSRDLVSRMQALGFPLAFARIPVSPSQSPDDHYLDEYVKHLATHPVDAPVLVSCGMGGGRTTLGCIVAMLIRRHQRLARGEKDPVPVPWADDRDWGELEKQAGEGVGMLRVVHVLDRAFADAAAGQAEAMMGGAGYSPTLAWALARPALLDALLSAVRGNYAVINDLTRVLDQGAAEKHRVDLLIDACAVLVHLREEILVHRVRGSLDGAGAGGGGGGGGERGDVERAVYCLERYFYLVAFAAYVADPGAGHKAGFSTSFSEWLGARPEIVKMAEGIRRGRVGVRMPLALFRPVEDLSILGAHHARLRGTPVGVDDEQRLRLAEVERYVLRTRSGVMLSANTLLKVDFWVAKHQRVGRGGGGDSSDGQVTGGAMAAALAVDSAATSLAGLIKIAGASRLRKIGPSLVYGVAQPTRDGMLRVHDAIVTSSSVGVASSASPTAIVWINLREEPIIYLNGTPHVLRDQATALRNVRAYQGITPDRLERMEERLKEDVVAELDTYDARVLVHTETTAAVAGEAGAGEGLGSEVVCPMWTEIAGEEQVQTLREVTEAINHAVVAKAGAAHATTPLISLYRVPVTAETPPDTADFDALVHILAQYPLASTAIVCNDQVGLGRTTTGTIICWLIRNWLMGNSSLTTACVRLGIVPPSPGAPRGTTYSCLHSLVRVIRNGLEVKRVVDDAVDVCAAYVNLRDEIDHSRQRIEYHLAQYKSNTPSSSGTRPGASSTSAPGHGAAGSHHHLSASPAASQQSQLRSPHLALALAEVQRGLLNLRRYFILLVFQAYLDDVPSSTGPLAELESFASWMRRHPEIRGMQRDLDDLAALVADNDVDMPSTAVDLDVIAKAMAQLVPVDAQTPGDGIALTSEVMDVVTGRRGAVLARMTILKHDVFPGCQKLSLPERIQGGPNFRHVPIDVLRAAVLKALSASDSADSPSSSSPPPPPQASSGFSSVVGSTATGVCGVAMPSGLGVRNVVERLVGQDPRRTSATVLWTCLREEPVVYVNSKPFVLRTFQEPIKNVEMTGISTERVESMEDRMKMDVLAELDRYQGRILLHEEEAEVGGKGLTIVPVWESVDKANVMTPREVYTQAVADWEAARGPEASRVLRYWRVPITDEQAPIPHVFDVLVDRVLDAATTRAASGYHCVFNCQMGRGRTTTANVIASLVHCVLLPSPTSRALVDIVHGGQPAMLATLASSYEDLAEPSAADSSKRYKRGDYQIVMQLIAVLAHGKLAKVVADVCIDQCSHMQNLREACYDYKVRTEALAEGAPVHKYEAMRTVAWHYLVRYCYLIAFAGYLLEERLVLEVEDGMDGLTMGLGIEVGEELERQRVREKQMEAARAAAAARRSTRFQDWLSERREIAAILESRSYNFE
ncbi:inositol hexakisphosphate-domain-containing protein [Catenaria anguillulae PL171]|uniref:Inositol hexakisphosphate-domain-containing protein n=1 Tax=Catenaria anguillulae PL171 TaxID=765915 RepID=A0A1Y2HQ21_9FUNG|nr:inositol hexakisphosphate-domain-containing protein [Catenaria anguillulae PL171]